LALAVLFQMASCRIRITWKASILSIRCYVWEERSLRASCDEGGCFIYSKAGQASRSCLSATELDS
jgi:hypothetical protein